jgi:hypothetical protein
MKLAEMFRRFLKKKLPFQDVGAGLITMSYLGHAGPPGANARKFTVSSLREASLP